MRFTTKAGAIDIDKAEKEIMTAYEKGVNYFDTAATYHQGTSEIITGEILKKYPDMKGFLGTASNDPPGAGKAIEEMGLIGKAFAVGTSVTSVAGPYLESGSVAAATCWDPAEAGYAMNVLAKMVLDGKRGEIVSGLNLGVPGFENITVNNGKYVNGQGWIVITKDNMSEYNF